MTSKPRTRKTRTSTDGTVDKVAQLHEQITNGVEALVTSEGWAAMLKAAARFHAYSLNNLMLIAMQAPDATQVAGFNTWKALGRQVRKGEKGIAILAPCAYRAKNSNDPSTANTDATKTNAPEPAPNTTTPDSTGKAPRQVRGFRCAYVFDLAQTDGDPLPDVRPQLLTGQAPARLWDDLVNQVTAHGYTVERGHCGIANGYTSPKTSTVRVRDDVDDAQAVKTLAHELAHIECGHIEDLPTYLTCRDRCEIEAESVACVVTAAAGLDASGYTLPYVATWAGGEVATVRAAAETVTKTARTILARLPHADEHPRSDTADAGAHTAAA